MQDNNPAASATRELKAAARDALRMGSQWAHTALHWIDERSNDMNNRNRDQEQRERAQRNRSASGYGSDESDYGSSPQYGSQPYSASGPSDVLGGRQASRDRDIRGQQHMNREGSYPQSGQASPEDFSQRGAYARGGASTGYAGGAYAGSSYQRGSQRNPSGGSRDYATGAGFSGYGDGSEGFDDQDFGQDYSQGSSHYGSQGFGAQGSQGVYGPQGFGSQGGIGARSGEYGLGAGFGGSGGYGRESHGVVQSSYRGLGPKNYTRSDERIREDLNERLTDAHDIDASGLSVEVNKGVATLTGSVDQRWMKHRAEDLAESCSGVRDVNNQIRVVPPSGRQPGSQPGAANAASSLGGSQSTQASATPSSTSASSAASPGNTGPATGNRSSGSSLS